MLHLVMFLRDSDRDSNRNSNSDNYRDMHGDSHRNVDSNIDSDGEIVGHDLCFVSTMPHNACSFAPFGST